MKKRLDGIVDLALIPAVKVPGYIISTPVNFASVIINNIANDFSKIVTGKELSLDNDILNFCFYSYIGICTYGFLLFAKKTQTVGILNSAVQGCNGVAMYRLVKFAQKYIGQNFFDTICKHNLLGCIISAAVIQGLYQSHPETSASETAKHLLAGAIVGSIVGALGYGVFKLFDLAKNKINNAKLNNMSDIYLYMGAMLISGITCVAISTRIENKMKEKSSEYNQRNNYQKN